MLNRFSSSSKKLNKVIQKINTNTLADFDLTGSLENIEIPSSKKYEAAVRSTPNTVKLVNNKPKINQFYTDILQYSGRYIKRKISEIDAENNKLIIQSVKLDYGTEEVSPNNFEVIVGGLNLPGIYDIQQVSSSVEITLKENFIDYQSVTENDIYVIGKILELQLLTNESEGLLTEDGKLIIL